MANFYDTYFGTQSQFDPTIYDDNTQKGFNNSYQNYGITVGLNKNRTSQGVEKDWRNNAQRTSSGIKSVNDLFGTNFTKVTDAQNYINQMLRNAAIRTGADFGKINVDNKWGNQTQSALDLVSKIYKDSGNNWNNQVASKTAPMNMVDQARTDFYGMPNAASYDYQQNKPLNTVNRKLVRMGMNTQQVTDPNGHIFNGIRNTDDLRWALQNQDKTKDNYFINDLRKRMSERKYDYNDDRQWSAFLQDAKINGNIGRKDMKDLRHWYNAPGKFQEGGQMPTEEDQQQQLINIANYLSDQGYDIDPANLDENSLQNAISQWAQDNDVDITDPNALATTLIPEANQYSNSTKDSVPSLDNIQNQQSNQEVMSAKLGSKLNYINYLKGIVPEGYEATYLKCGGRMVKQIKKKQSGGEMKHCTPNMKKSISGTVDKFKQDRITKKAKGGQVQSTAFGDKAYRPSAKHMGQGKPTFNPRGTTVQKKITKNNFTAFGDTGKSKPTNVGLVGHKATGAAGRMQNKQAAGKQYKATAFGGEKQKRTHRGTKGNIRNYMLQTGGPKGLRGTTGITKVSKNQNGGTFPILTI